MVRQVKKFVLCLVVGLILITALCGTVSATTYEVYNGNLSSTQITYFRDMLGNRSILDNYVVFRDDQNVYRMVVGKISLNGNKFISDESCDVYTLQTGTGTSNYYTLSKETISNLILTTNNLVVYSDLGFYPQLEERGQKYEILHTILIVIVCVCFVVRSIFFYRKR